MARQPHELFDSREQKADLEARNGLLQFAAIEEMVISSKDGFELKPSTLREFHRLAIQDIFVCAGSFRTENVYLSRNGVVNNERHQPPPWPQVMPLVDEMCSYVNTNFGRMSGIHLASYVMWRLNWIHPFLGGNGRCSRATSYLVLNVRLGFNLPGINSVAQQIERNRKPYTDALEAADVGFRSGSIDVSAMETLLSQLLASQLLSVHNLATAN
jgi:Fic family protein